MHLPKPTYIHSVKFSESEAVALRRYADLKARGNISKIIRDSVAAVIANAEAK